MMDKILIIDDDSIIRKITARIVKICGLCSQPLTFNNGKEAYDFLKDEEQINYRYIIFLDINMPLMNGWEFLDVLERENLLFNKEIYLITSSIDIEDHTKAKENKNVRDILTKPITLNKVSSLLKTF